MSYTTTNFKNKKALKEAVAAGKEVRVYNPSIGGPIEPNGVAFVEGPHHVAHTWYAEVILKDGKVIKVK